MYHLKHLKKYHNYNLFEEKNPESVNIPALTSEELMAPPKNEEDGEETSPFVPALEQDSKVEKVAAIAVAIIVGAVLGYCLAFH